MPGSSSGSGTGEIRGRVHTEAGEPVPAVKVTAEPVVEEEKVPEGASLAEEMKIIGRQKSRARAGRVVAESGADGAFALPGLAGEKYRLRAEREGYEFSGTGLYREIRPGRAADIVATAVVAIPVRVLLPDGAVPEKARIELSAEDRELTRTADWTPAEPTVKAPPGPFKLKAASGEGDEFTSDPVSVAVSSSAPPEPVTLQLLVRPGIRGHVTPPETWPAGYWITVAALKATPGEEEPSYERLSSEGRQAGTGEDSDFAYAFSDLKPGSYHLAALGNWNVVLARAVVEVADRMVEKDLVAQTPPRTGYLVVRAEGPDGKPAEVNGVNFVVEGENGTNTFGGSVGRLPDGTVAVDLPAEEGAGRITRRAVVVSSPAYGEKEVEFQRTDASEVAVRFDEVAWIEAEVSGRAEVEEAGTLRLNVFPSERQAYNWMGKEVGEDGKARLGPLQAGTYKVRLVLSRPRGYEVAIGDQSVPVRTGTTRLTVRVPPLYEFVVVAEGEGQRNFYLQSTDEQWAWGVQGEATPDGQVRFSYLPAGRYRVYCWGEDEGMMEVTVPGQSVLKFEPEAQNAYKVTVSDAAGVLARAGLQSGDLVTGIDGQEFEGSQHMGALLQAAVAKKSAKFTVTRGGETLTVEVATGEVRNNWNWGGELSPVAR